ncbi:MAG TPA: hypothetical protein VNA25_22745 [Phycisphaerae bacterium]|nr:hypothetical protein [Phycisphaerae bacterium]
MKPTAEEKLDSMPARIRAAVDGVAKARAAEARTLVEANRNPETGDRRGGD